MKKRNLFFKSVVIAGILSGFILLNSFTPGNKTDKIIIEELKAYALENIQPVLKPYKSELEANLSKDEKHQLKMMRKDLISLIKERKSIGLLPGEKTMMTSELTDEQVEVLKDTKNRFTNIVLQTMLIANEHEKELQLFLNEIQPNREEWITDIEKIIGNNRHKSLVVVNPIFRANIKKVQPMDNVIKVALLLWDTNLPI